MSKNFALIMSIALIPAGVFAMQSSQIVRTAFKPTVVRCSTSEAKVANPLVAEVVVNKTPEEILTLETLGKSEAAQATVVAAAENPIAAQVLNPTVAPEATEDEKTVRQAFVLGNIEAQQSTLAENSTEKTNEAPGAKEETGKVEEKKADENLNIEEAPKAGYAAKFASYFQTLDKMVAQKLRAKLNGEAANISENSEANTVKNFGRVSKEFVHALLFGTAAIKSVDVPVQAAETVNVEEEKAETGKVEEVVIPAASKLSIADKMRVLLYGESALKAATKEIVVIDSAKTHKESLFGSAPTESVNASKELSLGTETPVVSSYKKAAIALGVAGVAAACKYAYDKVQANENTVVPVASSAKKAAAFNIKNHVAKLPKITAKNVALAAVVTAGVTAIAYQLLSMYSRPSFDALVKQYIYETDETDAVVIIEQFIQALEKHGYTSVADKQKAMQVFVEAGLVEA